MPDHSGPNTSTMRPRGKPPIPRAMSSDSAPVETTSTLDHARVAHPHDRALAELALDLADGRFQGLVSLHVHSSIA